MSHVLLWSRSRSISIATVPSDRTTRRPVPIAMAIGCARASVAKSPAPDIRSELPRARADSRSEVVLHVTALCARVGLATLRIATSAGTICAVRPRVLIVDDNAPFRAAARQLLERSGFDVVAEAGTGAEGIQEAKAHRPDLAIVDVQLADLDGFEVAERLATLDGTCEVILPSSLDGKDFGALVTASSARGFIPKDELSAPAIRAMLTRTTDRASGLPPPAV